MGNKLPCATLYGFKLVKELSFVITIVYIHDITDVRDGKAYEDAQAGCCLLTAHSFCVLIFP